MRVCCGLKLLASSNAPWFCSGSWQSRICTHLSATTHNGCVFVFRMHFMLRTSICYAPLFSYDNSTRKVYKGVDQARRCTSERLAFGSRSFLWTLLNDYIWPRCLANLFFLSIPSSSAFMFVHTELIVIVFHCGSWNVLPSERFLLGALFLRLWRLLAESALENLQFTVAEKAFVQNGDYQVRVRIRSRYAGILSFDRIPERLHHSVS